jgi:hypothetical protein
MLLGSGLSLAPWEKRMKNLSLRIAASKLKGDIGVDDPSHTNSGLEPTIEEDFFFGRGVWPHDIFIIQLVRIVEVL